MSCASPFPQLSPSLHLLNPARRPTLDEHDPILHHHPFSFVFPATPNPHLASSLSRSPAQSRPVLTDLLHNKHINSPQSSRSKAVQQACFAASLESPRKGLKENREKTGKIHGENGSAGVSPAALSPLKRKRPSKLAVPESARLASLEKAKLFELAEQETASSEIHSYEGHHFGVASKKGRKDRMEDAHTATTSFQGKLNEAFVGVFDGHGGENAAKFASENLGLHIATAIQNQKGKKESLEDAMKAGYKATDSEFLAQRVSSGACSVSAFVREGQLVVANAGDCQAVLCRDGKAEALTTLHRASNEEERQRIEKLGGYVDCFNGVWRVQGSLAVTRGFGDMNLKQWISSEPEVKKLDITHDCEFLILASDGLWDKVSEQEAVDCARELLLGSGVLIEKAQVLDATTKLCKAQNNHHSILPSGQNKEVNGEIKTNTCNKLIQKACSRGNLDDITVMIVLLQGFSMP